MREEHLETIIGEKIKSLAVLLLAVLFVFDLSVLCLALSHHPAIYQTP